MSMSYVDENANQTCQPKIFKTCKLRIFLFKKQILALTGRFQKLKKKMDPDLFCAYASIFILLYSTKMLFGGSLGIMKILYLA